MQKRQKTQKRTETGQTKTGIIRITGKGMGFVEIEGIEEDILVEAEQLSTALNKDEVEIAFLPKRVKDRTAAKVLKVIKRAKREFVGTLEHENGRLFLIPDDKKVYKDIAITGGITPEAKDNTKVLVEMLEWSDPKKNPEGKIIKIIGEKGIHDVEMAAIVLEKGFDTEYPEDVLREAEAVSKQTNISPAELAKRRDFRSTLTFTIDPVDAKDFDDAISFKKLPNLPAPRPDTYFVYAILCEDNSIYIGQTSDLKKRWEEHSSGAGAEHTKKYKPLDIIHYEEYKNRGEAVKREQDLKTGFGRKWLQREWEAGRTRQAGGNFEIGVHIADVSHYVREHTALNREALKRGFSVYLVDRTIPMLPEALSNIVCSLNPNEDRLTFSAVFELDQNGHIKSRWFGKTVIHSAKRFSYESAQDVLNGKSAEHKEALETLNAIAKKLRAEKFKKGAIDFEQDEVRFELGENGRPLKIYKKERLDTHKLVEEYMLLANKEVAEFIFKARAKKQSAEPFIYRIHDLPDRERIANLGIFVKALGHNLHLSKGSVSAKDLTMLFEQIGGRAEESMIKTAAVRSMAKAIYSTTNIGHFGLSFEYYTHFTSPIRRYADLLVHRILFHHLNGTSIPANEWHSYEKMARENSEQEIAAAEAERDSKKLKQVEYMSERVGQIFTGIISGVTDWGMYIEEKETRCEGMVKLRDLGDDYYILDEKNYCLIGEKTKKKYSLGDTVKFKVAGADVERKTLDYSLA